LQASFQPKKLSLRLAKSARVTRSFKM